MYIHIVFQRQRDLSLFFAFFSEVNKLNIVDLISEISVKGGAVVLLLMTLIQVAPIKIDPWSAIIKWVAKIISKPVVDELSVVKKEVQANTRRMDSLEKSIGEEKAVTARNRILRFGDEIRCEKKHSREHFQSILREIDKYEAYCNSHPEFKNSMTVLTTQKIIDCYREREEKNDFL